jgi:2'-5' RNA ligase
MKIVVVIILPSRAARVCCEYATKASQTGEVRFALDNKNYIPHITLCRVEVEEDSVVSIIEELTSLTSKTKPLTLVSKPFSIVDDGVHSDPYGDHSLWLEFRVSKELKVLRKQVFNILKRFNTNFKYSKLSAYRPHVSLVRFRNLLSIQKAKKSIKYQPMEIQVTALALTNSVEYGQVSKIIRKFKLSAR